MDLLLFGIRFVARTAALVLALFLIGFVLFADSIKSESALGERTADGIVVPTGGKARISEAVRLLTDGKAKRLLITGVYATTTKENLRQLVDGDAALFECCVDVDRRALNTSDNAIETRRWARKQGYETLIVVTSGYHMPRVLVELERAMPKATVIPHPVVARDFDADHWWHSGKTLRVLFREYVKYLPALARLEATRLARRG